MKIKYNILILLSAITFSIAIISQYIWLKKTFEIFNNNQKNLINLAITKSANSFTKILTDKHSLSTDSLDIFSYLNKAGNSRVCFITMDSILNQEFSNNKIKGEFNYAFSCKDSLIFKSNTKLADTLYLYSEYQHKLFCGIYPSGLTLHIAINNKSFHFVDGSHLSGWIFLSIISMLLIATMIILLIQSINRINKHTHDRIRVINNMAHEFKTPIASINLASELLEKDEVASNIKRVKKYAELIHFENNRLEFVGDQILQIVLLEERQIALNISNLNCNKVIETFIKNYLSVRADINDKITLSLKATKPFIQADKGHLENIINNLLENAFKYGGEDVHISISSSNSGNHLLIIFEDDGIGIHKKYHKKIFKRYYRISSGNQFSIKGFGIGLYYVKSILDKMRGKITIDSSPNKGTRFTIRMKQ